MTTPHEDRKKTKGNEGVDRWQQETRGETEWESSLRFYKENG